MKSIKDFINEGLNNNIVFDYLKKTFKNVTVEEREDNECPNPYEEGSGDWIEYFLDDFDTVTSVPYSPKHNLFSICIDSVFWRIDEDGEIDYDENGPFEEEATLDNLKKYNKRSIKKIIKSSEEEW